MTLAPGEEARLLFLLGEGDLEAGKAAKTRWTPEKADEDFSRLAEFWDKKLSCLQVSTPNEGMNTELNIWNLYQSEINVMFSRFTSFIEVGGRVGLGYRDTAQDAMMVPHSNPENAAAALSNSCGRLRRRATACICLSRAGLKRTRRSSRSNRPRSFRHRIRARLSTV